MFKQIVRNFFFLYFINLLSFEVFGVKIEKCDFSKNLEGSKCVFSLKNCKEYEKKIKSFCSVHFTKKIFLWVANFFFFFLIFSLS